MTQGDTPVTVRLRLPYPDAPTFVSSFARHVTGGRLYLPTRQALALGTVVRFELLDHGGRRLLLGEGPVVEGAGPAGRVGAMVRVQRLAGTSKPLWAKLTGGEHGTGTGTDTEPADDPTETSTAPIAEAADTEATEPEGPEAEPEAEPKPESEAEPKPKPEQAAEPEAAVAEAAPDDDEVPEIDVNDPAIQEVEGEATPVTTDPDIRAAIAEARIPEPDEVSGESTPDPVREFPWEEPGGDDDDDGPGPLGEETLVGVFSQPTPLPVPGPALGIDLGTSRTLAAIAHRGKARRVNLGDAGGVLASVVAPGEWGGLEVGAEALRRRLEQPEHTIFGAKRLLGRKFHSTVTQALATMLPYPLVADPAGGVAVPMGDGQLTITEVHARILDAVHAAVTEDLGAAPSEVVVSVPANFGDAQRAAVREAGLQAGLEVTRIVSEPTAAALAYGYGRGLAAKRLVVYDLGGGTFDVSVLTVSGERFEVVATGGDPFLGGIDFDLRVVRRLLETVAAEGGPAQPGPRLLERLLIAAEEAKIALSTKDRHLVKLLALWEDDAGGEHDLAVELTREDLEALTADLVDRTLQIALEVLDRRGLTPDLVDDVILVGGQALMPRVRARVTEVFGRPPRDDVDPESAVAVGCALLAGSLIAADDPDAPAVQLQDVLSIGIGVGLPDGQLLTIIEATTPIPCERTLRVRTSKTNQASLEIVVFQGPGPTIDEAEYLGSLAFVDLPPGPAGEVSLQVRFALDPEGLLEVQALNEATGEAVERVLSTADTPEALRARLAEETAVIHDLTQPGALAVGDRGFLSGLRRRLFKGER